MFASAQWLGSLRRALISGISGQDGAYLAKHLLDNGYAVVGASRDAQGGRFDNLRTLGIHDRVQLVSMTLTDFGSVIRTVDRASPDEIYNLAGQSSVSLSFQQPAETIESATIGVINMLEAIRLLKRPVRFYNAGSGECFGDTGGSAATEDHPFKPSSPYAIAKAAAYWLVDNYRRSYDLFACTGILFNHESPLRPKHFVVRKVVLAALDIAKGKADRLALGNICIRRDWGWAPEYVVAMHRMLQKDHPEDFVIATGESHSLEELCEAVFRRCGLNFSDHVVVDASLMRPSDAMFGMGNPERANNVLDWQATVGFGALIERLVDAERQSNPGVYDQATGSVDFGVAGLIGGFSG